MSPDKINIDIHGKTSGPGRMTRQNPSLITKAPRWLYHLIKIGLAAVFIWSGISKLLAPQAFAVVIGGYGLVPENFLFPLALALCFLELLAGIGLLFDIQGSLGTMAGLLVLFMAVLSYGLWLGLDVDCGCFGPDNPEGQAFHGLQTALFRDMAMLTGVAYLYLCRMRRVVKPLSLSDFLSIILRRECTR